MKITEFIAYLRERPGYQGQIVHIEHLPARGARYGELTRPLPEPLAVALRDQGIERLYIHQAEAINAVRAGQNVIVSTSTASGKTLCYNIPVLESLLADPLSKALYLFPLKALEQDQLKGLYEIITDIDNPLISVEIYDGDTPISKRKRIRANPPNILITNPDMLHMGILANHSSWKSLFEHLSLVVIDEVHVYRGIFGSHMAQILRRLRRICRYYGSDPRFIMLSGTIQNPEIFSKTRFFLPLGRN